MTKTPPDRLTISLPDDVDLDPDDIDDLVSRSEAESRSEYIRNLLQREADGGD